MPPAQPERRLSSLAYAYEIAGEDCGMISTIRRALVPATFALAGLAVTLSLTAPASASAPTPTAQATVMTKTGPMGTYLTDAQGKSLYLFVADTTSTSTCFGACAAAWPPLVTAGAAKAGSGVDQTKLATTPRSGGSTQVTYNGHPLYLYAGDTAAGQTTGQGLNQFGALWWLVNPQGAAITGTGTPSPGGSPTMSPTGGGGGGTAPPARPGY
jgi:predicted lipoprotein with Yx(FWY)xxD motif